MKADRILAPRHMLSFSFLHNNDVGTNPFDGNYLGNFGSDLFHNQAMYGLSYTVTVTPSLINEVRAGLVRCSYVSFRGEWASFPDSEGAHR